MCVAYNFFQLEAIIYLHTHTHTHTHKSGSSLKRVVRDVGDLIFSRFHGIAKKENICFVMPVCLCLSVIRHRTTLLSLQVCMKSDKSDGVLRMNTFKYL